MQEAEALERVNQRRLNDAQVQRRLALDLLKDNGRLYTQLQLSHASLESAVRERTSQLKQHVIDLAKAKAAAEAAAGSRL